MKILNKLFLFVSLFAASFFAVAPARAAISNLASSSYFDPVDSANTYFGIEMTAGDIDGDGYVDAVVSATSYSGEASAEGRVYIHMGSASGLSEVPALTLDPTDQASANFSLGLSVADFNGDGYE